MLIGWGYVYQGKSSVGNLSAENKIFLTSHIYYYNSRFLPDWPCEYLNLYTEHCTLAGNRLSRQEMSKIQWRKGNNYFVKLNVHFKVRRYTNT